MARLDPKLQSLFDEFVRVRLIRTNGLDLSTFQFDFDMSFAGFFLNADGAIYGRFGSRSAAGSASEHFSLESLRKAMVRALELHAAYPKNRTSLAGKRGPAPTVRTPERRSALRRFRANPGERRPVANNCIHCQQVAEAFRRSYRDRGKTLPPEWLRPWPVPRILGLTMDPDEMATIEAVLESSSAARDGFESGDEILEVEGQPVLSVADVQWVLHRAGKATKIRTRVRRDGAEHARALTLPSGWRERMDISWRVSSWDMRRMILGGLRLRALTKRERGQARLKPKALGLFVKHAGKHGDHAVARRAGFRVGDIIVSFAGIGRAMTESDLLIDGMNRLKRGARVPVVVLRDRRRVKIVLRIQ